MQDNTVNIVTKEDDLAGAEERQQLITNLADKLLRLDTTQVILSDPDGKTRVQELK